MVYTNITPMNFTAKSDENNLSEQYPLITIITCTYNSNITYLQQAIESVLQQTYPNIEYIITDDGSKYFPDDEIRNILASKNRGNITWKIIRNEVNIGTVRNINGALRVAKGKYIFFASHDDIYYNENVLDEMVKKLLSTNGLIITSMRECINPITQEVSMTLPSKRHIQNIKNLSPSNLYSDLLKGNYIAGAGTAYANALFEKYGLFDESYRLVEDAPMILHVASQGEPIYFWDGISIKYRLAGVSSSNVSEIYAKDHLLLASRLWKSEHGKNKLFALWNLLISHWTSWKIQATIRRQKWSDSEVFYHKEKRKFRIRHFILGIRVFTDGLIIKSIHTIYLNTFGK